MSNDNYIQSLVHKTFMYKGKKNSRVALETKYGTDNQINRYICEEIL